MKKILLSLALTSIIFLTGCSGETANVLTEEDINPEMVIEFQDEEFEKLIREKVRKEEGNVLASDMAKLYSVNIDYREYPVKDISGLEYAINLNDFSYRYGEGLKSLDPISVLQELYYLNISYSIIEGNTSKFNTPVLETVSFIDTNVSNYDFLENAVNITSLYISDSGLESIDFIKNMNLLEELSLEENNISDITPVSNKTNLTSISLHKNEVVDISSLATCPSLETINISYNHVNNIEYLYDLENLNELTAYEMLDEKLIPRTQIDALIEAGVTVNYHK